MTTMNTSFRHGKHPALKADLSVEHLELWADRVIESQRHVTDSARTNYDEDVCERFPSSDLMVTLGVDIITIATVLDGGLLEPSLLGKACRNGLSLHEFCLALKDGLDVCAFAQALANGLDPELFSAAVECGMDAGGFAALAQSYDTGTLNGFLENFCDSVQSEERYPDPATRAYVASGDRTLELLAV
jgi:hypothetical protein